MLLRWNAVTDGRCLLADDESRSGHRHHRRPEVTVSLYGFSQGERPGRRHGLVGALFGGGRDWISTQRSDLERADDATAICNGGYPKTLGRAGRRQRAWFDNYLTRVVDHDAGELNRLVGVSRLGRVLRLIAANNAGELVRARIARDAGTEVDLVVETDDGSLIGIQVKASRTVTAGMFRGLEALRARLGSRFRMGLVLHTGPESLPFGDRMWAAPISCVWAAPTG